MNIAEGGMVGLALIEHGDISPGDVMTLVRFYRDFSAGKFNAAAITEAEVTTLGHVCSALTDIAKDPGQRADLVTFIKSFPSTK